jgi:hypothetical protein
MKTTLVVALLLSLGYNVHQMGVNHDLDIARRQSVIHSYVIGCSRNNPNALCLTKALAWADSVEKYGLYDWERNAY